MSRYERFSSRSLVYSKWHRLYLGHAEPMIDLDAVEYCSVRGCNKPLVLIETARDVGQAVKPTTVLRNLATASGVLALCVLYTISDGAHEATGCPCQPPRDIRSGCDHGISQFRVRKIWSELVNEADAARIYPWKTMTPDEFRTRLRVVRRSHIEAEHGPWEFAEPEAGLRAV